MNHPITNGKPVFWSAMLFCTTLVLMAILAPDVTASMIAEMQNSLVNQMSWLYILVVALFLIFAIYIMASRLGDIKLGPDHAEPDFSNLSWFSMLFSAGMGIGLMFFGVAEPVMHFLSPPVETLDSAVAASEALRITMFHWGLHGWAIYAVVALSLSYFAYRHKLPLLPRSALYPLIGDRIHGKIGHAVDTFAIVGTLFGVATSLGLGVSQVNAGLNFIFGVPQSVVVETGLIVVITLLAVVSVVLGLDAGIKRLSNLNMILAVVLLLSVLIFGATTSLLQAFVENTGNYMSELVNSTFNMYAYEQNEDWLGGWTVFYWGWWVSWSPFVGMFIARVSFGRTIREFIVGVLFIPVGFTFLWMTTFGNAAITDVMAGNQVLADAINSNVATAIFVFLEPYPLSFILAPIALLLVVTFFITSADSGALVIDTLASGGDKNSPVWSRVYWTVMIGLISAALLYSGGLATLQTLVVASAFPFMLYMLAMCYSFFKAVRHDYMLQTSVQSHSTGIQQSQSGTDWEQRLDLLHNHPGRHEANSFIQDVVFPSLKRLQQQLELRGVACEVTQDDDKARLVILIDSAENFAYGVRLRNFVLPSYADEKRDDYYRAEVFLLRGGQQYDVLGYNQDQLIADAIGQYERHLHYIYLASSEILEDVPAVVKPITPATEPSTI